MNLPHGQGITVEQASSVGEQIEQQEVTEELGSDLPQKNFQTLQVSQNQTTHAPSEQETYKATNESTFRNKNGTQNIHGASRGGITVTRGSSTRGGTGSQQHNTIQHPELYLDSVSRRIKTRNSVGQSHGFTTQMDNRLRTLEYGQKNSSMGDMHS
jgi:hypothetical protein